MTPRVAHTRRWAVPYGLVEARCSKGRRRGAFPPLPYLRSGRALAFLLQTPCGGNDPLLPQWAYKLGTAIPPAVCSPVRQPSVRLRPRQPRRRPPSGSSEPSSKTSSTASTGSPLGRARGRRCQPARLSGSRGCRCGTDCPPRSPSRWATRLAVRKSARRLRPPATRILSTGWLSSRRHSTTRLPLILPRDTPWRAPRERQAHPCRHQWGRVVVPHRHRTP